MTRADILALAERVEAATGADRELDYLVAESTASGGAVSHYEGQRAIFAEPWSHQLYEGHYQSLRNHGYPRYMTSIDAAMSLTRFAGARRVEFGTYEANGHCWAYVHIVASDVVGESDGCASEPAALTAASLRAIAGGIPE